MAKTRIVVAIEERLCRFILCLNSA